MCSGFGVCLVENISGKCACELGRFGGACQYSYELCSQSNCSNRGQCLVDTLGVVTCSCQIGATGANCATIAADYN